MRYLDPKNYLTFKKIFGEHPHLLKSFLNALMPFNEGTYIESLEYISNEMVPEIPLVKNSIVDVRCKDNQGHHFIVEIQMLWTDSFKSRVLFNASKAFVTQLGKGKKYESLQPVYALNFVNENYLKSESFYHHYNIVDIKESNERLEGLEFIFVELQKFKPNNFSQRKMQVLWLKFLTEIQDGEEIIDDELINNRDIKEALDILQVSAFTKEELYMYDKYWDAISTERTLISERTAMAEKKGLAKGLEKGIEQGLVQGIKKGIEQGIERGIEQGMQESKIEIARNLKKGGFDDHKIVELTGLNLNQIEDL